MALAAYRVLQESLTNVARHAGARRVAVRLRVSPALLALEVTDDGRGFPGEGAGRPQGRNGLLGMRERAFALGGALETGNVPTGGARVRLRLPLSAPANEVSP
jgi:signal transduction histidine kinase